MHRMALLTVVSALALGSAAAQSEPGAPSLHIGEPAPALEDRVEWVRGEPVERFQEGHVYVIDFWAPWCGPCIRNMPVVHDLEEKHADDPLTIIAVAVWPQPGMTPVEQFVDEHQNQMTAHVAKDIDRAVVETYLEALGENGIPTTVVIDQQGRLAWVGHPAGGLEDVVGDVLSGEYDLAAARQRWQDAAEAEALVDQADEAGRAGDWDRAFELIDQAVALAPDRFADLALVKFQYMVGRFGQIERGYAYGEKILGGVIADRPHLLENMARFIVEVPGLEPRDLDMAKRAIDRAVELTGGEEPMALETKAAVCAARKDFAGAVELQRRAIELTEQDHPLRTRLERDLERYVAAHEGGR